MDHNLPANALYVAVVTEPARTRQFFDKLTGAERVLKILKRDHPEVYDTDLNNVLAAIADEYEHRCHALICVDLDTGDVEKLDWQRELDGWREDRSYDPQEHSTHNRVGTGCQRRVK